MNVPNRTVTGAVAQLPFTVLSNQFCTLHPLILQNGALARLEDFKDTNDVWWMLTDKTRWMAEPGRLLTATLERSREYGKSHKAWFQVQVDSVRPTGPRDFVEIITPPPAWIREPREMLSRARSLVLNHPPIEEIYIRWENYLYGPLQTDALPVEGGNWDVHLRMPEQARELLRIPVTVFDRLPPGGSLNLRVKVSLDDRAPYLDAQRLHECVYCLVPSKLFREAFPPDVEPLRLESLESTLNRVSGYFTSLGKRKQLIHLYSELTEDSLQLKDEDVRFVRSLATPLIAETEVLSGLAEKIVHSGILDDELARVKGEYIERQADLLRLEVEAKITDKIDQLRAMEEEEQRRAKQRSAEERRLEVERHKLEHQREEVELELQKLATRLLDGNDELVHRLMSVGLLLRQVPVTTAAPAPVNGVAPAMPAPPPVDLAVFDLPAFLTQRGASSASDAVSEIDFFERFCEHVATSGFEHRRLDLAAFHISVKCNDLTILGGPPGTGKSSLPRLYAEALAGEEYEEGRRRFLHVGVSPSWLDEHDLLGHANALDHRFQPAEAGLYQQLIWAQEEEARKGADTRLYLICLDEMNLAQVEHYFGAFLQALERPTGQREVRCFAPELVAASDPFAPWHKLVLPRSLRFAGTVNFDETTRQLSQRVLDRANLIRLRPPELLDAREPILARSSGPAITQRAYLSWQQQSIERSPTQLSVLERLRDSLARLGCPLNQRRSKAIWRALGTTPPEICQPEQLLDLQIAQRILPQVRGLFRKEAREALSNVKAVLESVGFEESLVELAELTAGDYANDSYREEDGA